MSGVRRGRGDMTYAETHGGGEVAVLLADVGEVTSGRVDDLDIAGQVTVAVDF